MASSGRGHHSGGRMRSAHTRKLNVPTRSRVTHGEREHPPESRLRSRTQYAAPDQRPLHHLRCPGTKENVSFCPRVARTSYSVARLLQPPCAEVLTRTS